jgi:hypothetical protein
VDAGVHFEDEEIRGARPDAILADAALTSAARACLARFFAWGAAPTVDGYCALFAPGATLLDADMPAPIRGEAIRESITRVLTLLPDFRFAPVDVVAEGAHVFVRAANRASLGDRALAWDAVYALTLAGDRIGAGRRYYDQAALLTGAETFGADHRPPPAGGTVPGGQRDAKLDLAAREAAWNGRDVGALLRPLGPVSLTMSGVADALRSTADVAAACARFAVRAEGLAVSRGAVATTAAATAVEWCGHVGLGAAVRRFAMVEWIADREWRLVFNTLGF